MSFWQKTMLWLGLGPDEMYEGMSDGVQPRKWPNEHNESEISNPKSSKNPIKARLIEKALNTLLLEELLILLAVCVTPKREKWKEWETRSIC